MEEILEIKYDSAISFYGKATVSLNENILTLKSYNTVVAKIIKNKPLVENTYSQTTLRHIKEFLKQNGFKAETKNQILEDYGKVKQK